MPHPPRSTPRLIALLTAAALNPPASAVDVLWANAAAAWETGTNWQGNVAPANDLISDRAVFPQDQTFRIQPAITGTRQVGALRIEHGAPLQLTGTTLQVGSTIEVVQPAATPAVTSTIACNLSLANPLQISFNRPGTGRPALQISGSISGSQQITVNTSPGTGGLLWLSRPAGNANTGGYAITNSALQITNTSGSATGSGPVSLGANAVLRGNGYASGTVTLTNNAALSPGTVNPADTLVETVAGLSVGPVIINGTARYEWTLADAGSAAGDGYDYVQVVGTLNLTNASTFTIALHTVGGAPFKDGEAIFSGAAFRRFRILRTTGGIVGYDPAKIALDTSAFLNPLLGGAFSIEREGNDLVLIFRPFGVFRGDVVPNNLIDVHDVRAALAVHGLPTGVSVHQGDMDNDADFDAIDLARILARNGSMQRRFYLVRHTERDGGTDPPINPEGVIRSAALAFMVEHVGLTHIVTSNFIRNQQTVQPAADLTTAPIITRILPISSPNWALEGNLTGQMLNDLNQFPWGSIVLNAGHTAGYNDNVLVQLGGTAPGPNCYREFHIVLQGPHDPVQIFKGSYARNSSLDFGCP